MAQRNHRASEEIEVVLSGLDSSSDFRCDHIDVLGQLKQQTQKCVYMMAFLTWAHADLAGTTSIDM